MFFSLFNRSKEIQAERIEQARADHLLRLNKSHSDDFTSQSENKPVGKASLRKKLKDWYIVNTPPTYYPNLHLD